MKINCRLNVLYTSYQLEAFIVFLFFFYAYFCNSVYAQQIWTSASSLETDKLLASIDGKIYARTRYSGLYYTSDLGESWIKTGLAEDFSSFYSCIRQTSNGYIFVGDNNVWRSTDNGVTFSLVYDRNDAISISVDDSDNVFVGSLYSGIRKSSDYGQTWARLVPSNSCRYGDIFQINDSVYVNGYAFVFAAPGGPYAHYYTHRTTDNGQSWNIVLDGADLCNFVEDDYGYLFALDWYEYKFYSSTNDGITWQVSDHDASSMDRSTDNVLFTAIQNYISYSSNHGITWNSISHDGINFFIEDLICYQDTLIFIANSEGIFKRDQKVISLIENDINSLEFSLDQNYPNPFNPITRIKYQIPITTFVTLKIFDILGREYATLVNEEKKSGSYEVTFNASKLTSGCYYYQMRSKNFSKTMKMVVTK